MAKMQRGNRRRRRRREKGKRRKRKGRRREEERGKRESSRKPGSAGELPFISSTRLVDLNRATSSQTQAFSSGVEPKLGPSSA